MTLFFLMYVNLILYTTLLSPPPAFVSMLSNAQYVVTIAIPMARLPQDVVECDKTQPGIESSYRIILTGLSSLTTFGSSAGLVCWCTWWILHTCCLVSILTT